MTKSGIEILESWREHARDPYAYWQPRWITTADIIKKVDEQLIDRWEMWREVWNGAVEPSQRR